MRVRTSPMFLASSIHRHIRNRCIAYVPPFALPLFIIALACLVINTPFSATAQGRPIGDNPRSFEFDPVAPKFDELSRNPELLEVPEFLTEVLDETEARGLANPGDWNVEEALRYIIRRLPDGTSFGSMRANHLLGLMLLAQGREGLAIRSLSNARNQAIELDAPRTERARIEIALVSAQLGRDDPLPYASLDEVAPLGMEGDSATATKFVRALVGLRLRRWPQAVELLEAACADFPQDRRWVAALGSGPHGSFDAHQCQRILLISAARLHANGEGAQAKPDRDMLIDALAGAELIRDRRILDAAGAHLVLLAEPLPIGGAAILFVDGEVMTSPIDISPDELKILIARLRHKIRPDAFLTTLDPRIFENTETECRIGKQLFDILLAYPVAQLEGRIRPTEKLTLIVDREFLSLPFSTLPAPNPGNIYDGPAFECRRLIEDYAIELVEAAEFPQPRQVPEARTRGTFFSFSDPDYRKYTMDWSDCREPVDPAEVPDYCYRGYSKLYETRSESLAIGASLDQWSAQLYFDQSASADQFAMLGQSGSFAGPNILHFAAHGGAPEEIGGGGGIVLSWSVDEDAHQILSPSDIAQYRYDGAWIILSNCNTGAEGVTGDGGLADAFLKNGARAVLLTQWPVSDQVAMEIVSSTVDYWWNRDLDEASALRQAVIDEIEKDRWAQFSGSPSFPWGAFTLVLNPEFAQ